MFKMIKKKLRERNKYADQYLLRSLRELAKKLGKTPTVYDVQQSKECADPSTYKNHFCSFSWALRKAGLQKRECHSKKELLKALRSLYLKLKRSPRREDLGRKNNIASSTCFAKRFGSVNNALRLANIPINKTQKEYTKKELIRLLRSSAKKLGRTPRRKDIYSDNSMPDPNTYKNRFGSFNNAIRIAGLGINNSKFFYYSNDELIDLLAHTAKKIGRTPNKYDFKNLEVLPSVWIYYKRFGSYTNAALQAGLKPNEGFPDELAVYWQEHCVKIAEGLFGDIKTNKGHDKKVGKPDIWVEKKKLYIDAKLSAFHAKRIKDQIKRYTKDNYALQFWCLHKMPKLEIEHERALYIYAADMVSLFKRKISDGLLSKTYQFLNRDFSPHQHQITEFDKDARRN